jgi:protein-disulfide isomerase
MTRRLRLPTLIALSTLIVVCDVWSVASKLEANGSLARPTSREVRQSPQLRLPILSSSSAALPRHALFSANTRVIATGLPELPSKGSPDASVVVLMVSDFFCPFSRRFAQSALPRMEREYVATGKASIAFAQSPDLSRHVHARVTAQGASCAEEQGKFWEMHDRIFRDEASMDIPSIVKWATDAGIATASFKACLSGPAASGLRRDAELSRRLGVSATPTFVIADRSMRLVKRIEGFRDYSVLTHSIDEILQQLQNE